MKDHRQIEMTNIVFAIHGQYYGIVHARNRSTQKNWKVRRKNEVTRNARSSRTYFAQRKGEKQIHDG